jgi:hypothetical protein
LVRINGPLGVNGDPPRLVGTTCDELLIQQYWYRGELVDPANVAYLRFAGSWHRLCFDLDIVFWQPATEPPECCAPDDAGYGYTLVDIGGQLNLQGIVLDRLVTEGTEDGVEVNLAFCNEVEVVFHHVADTDTTNYRVQPAEQTPRVGG